MSTAAPVTVAIVNDYEVVVRGVHAMLAPFEDRIEVVEVSTTTAVGQPVDVRLYDTFASPRRSGRGMDALLGSDPGALVVYSWNVDPELVEHALAKGCRGYLDKSMAAEDLVTALERVADGEVVVTPPEEVGPAAQGVPTTLPAPDLVAPESDWPGRQHGLSPREAEVVALITQGLTNQDIADRTYLSINSVKTYIRTAYRKMGVARRSQAVGWGVKHGMLPEAMADRTPTEAEAQQSRARGGQAGT